MALSIMSESPHPLKTKLAHHAVPPLLYGARSILLAGYGGAFGERHVCLAGGIGREANSPVPLAAELGRTGAEPSGQIPQAMVMTRAECAAKTRCERACW